MEAETETKPDAKNIAEQEKGDSKSLGLELKAKPEEKAKILEKVNKLSLGLENIKNLRGIFYRKITEAESAEEQLPGFSIKKINRLIDFPAFADATQLNITYPLIEPFAYVNIRWDQVGKTLMYFVIEPTMSKEEKILVKKISDGLIELVEVELTSIKEPEKATKYLQDNVTKVLREYGIKVTASQYVKIMYYIYRNFVGFNEIEAFLQDPNIEDISCDGVSTPMYIIHRKYGSLKTNIMFENIETLREFIIKLSERCGRYVSYAEPILTGTLPDGSRVSATLAGDVATRGPTFTIRKFGEKPLSPVDQMNIGTADSEILAYFWYLMEHGISMLIVGGVATGKTSFLNTVLMFIPPEAKIVSIEDTREIRIPHEHWIPGLARVGFGIPTQSGEKYGEVTLFDLLKESFRQNPDYVIVGEVRGAEAYVMFQGMSSGHPCLSTFHAGSVETVLKRLTTPPIELSPTLIESLDIITIMVHAREKSKSARRIKEITEIESVDAKTGEITSRVIFRWNPITDAYEKVGESMKVAKVVGAIGGNMQDALAEIQQRKQILEWLQAQDIKDYREVTALIDTYYKEPQKLFDKMGTTPIIHKQKKSQLEEPIGIRPKQSKLVMPIQQKISILDLFNFKFIREK